MWDRKIDSDDSELLKQSHEVGNCKKRYEINNSYEPYMFIDFYNQWCSIKLKEKQKQKPFQHKYCFKYNID